MSSGPDKPALAVHAYGMASVVNINEVLDGHVRLGVECVDRLSLNACCPLLQVGGQVVRFLTGHLGHPIPSPVMARRSRCRSGGLRGPGALSREAVARCGSGAMGVFIGR